MNAVLKLFRRKRENAPLLTDQQHDDLYARAVRYSCSGRDGSLREVVGRQQGYQDGYLAAIRDIRKGVVTPWVSSPSSRSARRPCSG